MINGIRYEASYSSDRLISCTLHIHARFSRHERCSAQSGARQNMRAKHPRPGRAYGHAADAADTARSVRSSRFERAGGACRLTRAAADAFSRIGAGRREKAWRAPRPILTFFPAAAFSIAAHAKARVQRFFSSVNANDRVKKQCRSGTRAAPARRMPCALAKRTRSSSACPAATPPYVTSSAALSKRSSSVASRSRKSAGAPAS